MGIEFSSHVVVPVQSRSVVLRGCCAGMGADGGRRQRGVPAGGGPASTELRPGGGGRARI